jgi:hypothetical protein
LRDNAEQVECSALHAVGRGKNLFDARIFGPRLRERHRDYHQAVAGRERRVHCESGCAFAAPQRNEVAALFARLAARGDPFDRVDLRAPGGNRAGYAHEFQIVVFEHHPNSCVAWRYHAAR